MEYRNNSVEVETIEAQSKNINFFGRFLYAMIARISDVCDMGGNGNCREIEYVLFGL